MMHSHRALLLCVWLICAHCVTSVTLDAERTHVGVLDAQTATAEAEVAVEGGKNCGGNCPNNNCYMCPCGEKPKQLTKEQQQELCGVAKSGPKADENKKKWGAVGNLPEFAACCQCILTHESKGNLAASNKNGDASKADGSYDVGVFAINSSGWYMSKGKPQKNCKTKPATGGSLKSAQGWEMGIPPCDVDSNLECAAGIVSSDRDFSAWATCQFCRQACGDKLCPPGKGQLKILLEKDKGKGGATPQAPTPPVKKP